jgi:DNA adenine methylase
MSIGPVLKYPGSKWRIADWIVSHMPKHKTYLEPYFGSGAVLFNKTPSPIETVNDLDENVTNLFKLVRDFPEELVRRISGTPYSRREYDMTFDSLVPTDEFEKVRRFLVQCWQGHGFRTNGYKVGWKNDVQGREKAYALSNWYRLPDWILQTTERLRQVQIECCPALDVIRRHPYDNVLIYADPPYVLSTRTAKQYRHEMTDYNHIELLEALECHPGPVLLTGYDCKLYSERLKHWPRKTIKSLAEYGLKREEVLWINPAAAKQIGTTLF